MAQDILMPSVLLDIPGLQHGFCNDKLWRAQMSRGNISCPHIQRLFPRPRLSKALYLDSTQPWRLPLQLVTPLEVGLRRQRPSHKMLTREPNLWQSSRVGLRLGHTRQHHGPCFVCKHRGSQTGCSLSHHPWREYDKCWSINCIHHWQSQHTTD